MAINKKGKRRITVDSKKYLWWVFDEWDQTVFDGVQIKIVDVNQIGYIQYGLQQDDKQRHTVVSLRDEKYKVHMLSPKFEDEGGVIRPSGIAKLVKWSLEKENSKDRIFVHGYSTELGIIPEGERGAVFEMVANEFLK